MTCHSTITPFPSRAALIDNARSAIKEAKDAVIELHLIAESLSAKRDEDARRSATSYAALAQGLLTGALRDLERAMR